MSMKESNKAGKRVRAKFCYNNPDNFVVCWNGVTFGITGGGIFTDAKFSDKAQEANWVSKELMFIDGIKERIETYYAALIRIVDTQVGVSEEDKK